MRISDWSSDVCSSDLVEEPYIAAGTVSSFSQQGLPVAIEWAFARVEERGAMRALWTKLRDRAGDDRDACSPIGMGAAVEYTGAMRGAIGSPAGESTRRILVSHGEDGDAKKNGSTL